MIVVLLMVIGLAFGSFINALIWRLHEQPKAKSKKQKAKLSIVRGRSICPRCGHGLAAADLVPVLSWLWLRGRCRYCHKRIDDNPLVEITLPLLFVISYLFWPLAFDTHGRLLFIVWLVALVGLVALAVYDLRWYLLPDKLTYSLFALAALQILSVTLFFQGGSRALLDGALGLVVGGGLFYGLFQVSHGKWIGGGDVKLGGALGLLLGTPALALFMLFAASALGTAVALPLMAAGRADRKTHLPFGPFLIVATVVARLCGQSIINWYRHRLLLY